MKIIKQLFLLAILLFVSLAEAHPQYTFRHWDVNDGLSDNQIRYFTNLPDGRMAVRTASILNIYNGATFQHFYHDRRKNYNWSFNRNQIFKDYHDAYNRLWLKAPGYLSLFDLETNQFIYNIDEELSKLGVTGKLKDLFVDDSKNYWFLTESNDFLFYDITAKELKTIENSNPRQGVPREIAQYKNLYYIVYSGGLIRCWDRASAGFVTKDTTFVGRILESTDRLKIQPTPDGNLWLMYNNAVYHYNKEENTWKEITSIKGASNFFTSMDLDKDQNVWLGTSWSGLRKINHRTHAVETIPGLRLNDGSILNNDIQCIATDANGGLWVGTLWQGLCYYHPNMYRFKLIQTIQSPTLVTNEVVRCLLEDEDRTILIGTTNNGLMRYNPRTGEITKAFPNMLTNDLCLSLYKDSRKRLWVGTYLNGFYCIDGNQVKRYNYASVDMELYPNKNISRAVYEDSQGRFWVSVSNEGVGQLDLQTGRITMLRDKHPKVAFHKRDFNFYPISNDTFAVFGENGIYYYNTAKDQVYVPEIDDPDNPKYMGPQVKYNCMLIDSRSLQWFGTDIGIRVWDEQHRKAYTINTTNGLASNSISSIIEDKYGNYWVSTISSITRIELKDLPQGEYQFNIVNFGVQDGLQGGRLYENAYLKTVDDQIYFGGHHGTTTFNPAEISYNTQTHTPVFVAFKIFNELIQDNTTYNGRVILEKPINKTSAIHLKHYENFISFEFAGLNYVNPNQTYYRYKLENFDPEWKEINTTGLGTASYTGLQPGKYKLVVYTANNDKIWGTRPAEISIIISPPFWATTMAYLFYILLFSIFMLVLFRYYQKRKRRKQLEQEAIKREQQKEELNQMKFRFFTNISHEFRTPLTLIMTPLSTLIHQTENPVKDKLKAIYQNAGNMLELINQLLDFRKLEMGGEKLQISRQDLVAFIKIISSPFYDLAANRSITFSIESQCPDLVIGFDKTKIQKVLNNIYSNAFKFTPAGGQVSTTIAVGDDQGTSVVRIAITDTGCGIEEQEIDSIFDRFYQASPTSDLRGSGIGLHLVKEYIVLHNGRITVQSKPGHGTTFTISLPLNLAAEDVMADELPADIAAETTEYNSSNTPGKQTILVVEDNAEFRKFLVEQFSDHYTVLEAADGEEGESIALQKSPDLIISDLMMPRVDGIEMCNRIKSNIQTSHIPIILLTARLSDEARIESYRAGADSYISKPFNFEVLSARVGMLFEQLEKRKELFHKSVEISPQSITITSLDEEFVKKAIRLVEENIDDPELSVNHFCDTLGMSRSQLYRKFQSITGLTPNDFIRSVRLKQAAQLLQNSSYNISEIATLVGFNSIKYFNKYFKEEFDATPTQYRSRYMK